MTITPESAAATIVFLAPGFVLLSVFYWFGLQVRRSDAQWLIWSLIASVAVKPVTDLLPGYQSAAAFVLAITGGILLALAWHRLPAIKHLPTWARDRLTGLHEAAGVRAWDFVMERAAWLQVELIDGRTFIGLLRSAAKSSDTDDLDLYFTNVSEVIRGRKAPVDGHGMLVRRADTRMIIPFAWDLLPSVPAPEPDTP